MATTGHVLCFGELLLRLSAPGRGHLFQEPRLEAHFGGAEANVAVALARLGVASAIVSAAPDDALGDAAVEAMRRHGVDTTRIVRKAGRLGLYFLTPGAGLRASAIVYDRENSLFATSPRDAYDWPALLAKVRRCGGRRHWRRSRASRGCGPSRRRSATSTMRTTIRWPRGSTRGTR